MSRKYRLVRRQFIPRGVEETFAFFSDAMNLEAITPAFLKFKILTRAPIIMRPGTVIDYHLRIMHVPVHWQSTIDTFEPNRRFTDTQLRGPYRRWRHLHEFTPVDGGTLMSDCVEYELPGGPLGTLAHALFVGRTLERIFDYRRDKVAELLGAAEYELVLCQRLIDGCEGATGGLSARAARTLNADSTPALADKPPVAPNPNSWR